MAQRVEHHPLDAAFAALLANGLDGAGEALRILVNEASKIEFLAALTEGKQVKGSRLDYFAPSATVQSLAQFKTPRSSRRQSS